MVRIVLAEKGVSVISARWILPTCRTSWAELNPYNTVPTLWIAVSWLCTSRIIMEYLDERFPAPAPDACLSGGTRQQPSDDASHRAGLVPLADKIMAALDTEAARAELRDNLLAIAPIFGEMPYFASEEFPPGGLLLRLRCCGVFPAWVSTSPVGAKELKALHGAPVRA